MQLDLGRYLLPFGRAHQMSKVSKSAPLLPPVLPSRLYKSGAQTKKETKLSEFIWSLKDRGIDYEIKWEVMKRAAKYKSGMWFCPLCNLEKVYILREKRYKMINSRAEVMSKYLHKASFLLNKFEGEQSRSVAKKDGMKSISVTDNENVRIGDIVLESKFPTKTKSKKSKDKSTSKPEIKRNVDIIYDDEYEVEKILNKRMVDNKTQYLIKWRGYDHNENTWERIENIFCLDEIERFENRLKFERSLENIEKLGEEVVFVAGNTKRNVVKTGISQNDVLGENRIQDVTNTETDPRDINSITQDGLLGGNQIQDDTSNTQDMTPGLTQMQDKVQLRRSSRNIRGTVVTRTHNPEKDTQYRRSNRNLRGADITRTNYPRKETQIRKSNRN